MKKTLLIFVMALLAWFLFSACGTTSKVKTQTETKIDSVSNIHKDTTSVTIQNSKTQNFSASDIDIDVDYADGSMIDSSNYTGSTSTDHKTQKASPEDDNFAKLIQDAVANSGNAGNISSIHIHVGSLGDSTSIQHNTDSTNVKSSNKSSVDTSIDTKTKTVTRTGLGAGMYYIIGGVVLILLILAVIKFKLY